MSAPSPSLQLSMAANLGGLELARLKCRQFLQAQQIEQATLDVFELVLEECVTNTLQYGYAETGLRWIELAVSLGERHLELRIEDDAAAFDPLAHPEPALPSTLDDARVGGLGLLMVKRSAEALTYSRQGGRNRLVARIARRG